MSPSRLRKMVAAGLITAASTIAATAATAGDVIHFAILGDNVSLDRNAIGSNAQSGGTRNIAGTLIAPNGGQPVIITGGRQGMVNGGHARVRVKASRVQSNDNYEADDD